MKASITIPITSLLPDIPDHGDRCIDLLEKRTSELDAVLKVSVKRDENSDREAELEILFDSGKLSESHLRQNIHLIGEDITQRIGHLLVAVPYITQAEQANTVGESLLKTNGILEASASATGSVRVEFDREKLSEHRILEQLKTFDNDISIISRCCNGHHHHENGHHEHNHDENDQKSTSGIFSRLKRFLKEDTDLLFSLTCGTLLLTGWLLSFLGVFSDQTALYLYIGAYFFGGYYTSIDVWHSLRNKKFDIHLLMLVAAIGAATLGAWAEGALLLFLFSLGHSLEHYAMGKARNAISALAELTPKTALIKRDGREQSIPVENIQTGDILLIKPGERAAADGFVIKGRSSMDQAPITGESIPVDKFPAEHPGEYRNSDKRIPPAHRIFAGAINGDQLLEVEVTAPSKDSTLSRVIQMVREAETQKSPTQRFAERFEKWFVPAILVFVSMLMFAWTIIDEPFSDSFYRAMAVMVAASPCALAISTPSAVLSGIARAAKLGILVKGGGPLELLNDVDTIAFDKTGTITEGKPKITDVISFRGVSEQSLLQLTVAAEMHIDHPLARAIVHEGQNRQADAKELPEVSDLTTISGKGIKGIVNDKPLLIGNEALFFQQLPEEVLSAHNKLLGEGKTTMIVRYGEDFMGIIGLMDTPRKDVVNVIESLKNYSRQKLIMISGDHNIVAEAVGKSIGIDEAFGDLLPQDKAQKIRALSAEGRKVAMVGDGVNDAPAMAHASVGIAMGAAGSDVALETADIALMGDDLRKLPVAFRLSSATRKIITQNLFISLGMIAFLVPVTLLGYANMGVAVLLHEGSTLVVVLNALRLLGFREHG